MCQRLTLKFFSVKEWDIWTKFVNEYSRTGLALDSLVSSHPVEVHGSYPSSAAADNLFTLSYLKSRKPATPGKFLMLFVMIKEHLSCECLPGRNRPSSWIVADKALSLYGNEATWVKTSSAELCIII